MRIAPARARWCWVPTDERAEQVALTVFPFTQAVGLSSGALTPAWAGDAGAADILVATPETALAAVRGSALKLQSVSTLVVDGASDIQQLGGLGAVDTLLDHLDRDAQRVLFSGRITDEVDDLVDRRIRKALRYPTESVVPDRGGASGASSGRVGYVLVPEGSKVDILARPALRAAPRQRSTGGVLPQRRARGGGCGSAHHPRLPDRRAGRPGQPRDPRFRRNRAR